MAKTVNTEMNRLMTQGKKLKTRVNIEFRPTNNSTAIILSTEQAIELAHQIIMLSKVNESNSICLTIIDNGPNSMSVTA